MSDKRIPWDMRYISPSHNPNAEPDKSTYWLAHGEFAFPSPATAFSHFPKINAMTGGLRPYEFTILCGATGTGKTTLCANLSRDFIDQGIPHFVASVETGRTDYVKRIISAMVGHDWNTGDPVPKAALQLFDAEHGHKFKNESHWFSLYDDRGKVEDLMADIAAMVRDHKIRVAIIDNMNFFLEVTRASDTLVEMDRVIHELIIFCKQVPVHVIMVMHPKKTDHGRVESEFDIKGSSTAVQEAHNVLLFNRPHPDLIKNGVANEGDRELLLSKMRRRGKYVRRRVILKARNCVQYFEGEML
jgi:replicative DNA helicase